MFWRARTGLMFVLMTMILVAIGSFVGYLFNQVSIGFIVMLILAVILCIYSYYGSKGSALRAHDVHLVTEAEEPRLYGIVSKLAREAGLPMPEVGISETSMPNAFATGRGPKDAAVVATRGILRVLKDDELEGVFAHELAHVKNRDILVMSVVSTMAAVISFTSRYAIYMVMMGGDDRNNQSRGLNYILALVMSITIPIAVALIQLGVSRNREYLADETGARMTGNPRALARALRSIEEGCERTEDIYSEKSYADMWISNPLRGNSRTLMSRLFSTHPPTGERIKRLNALADQLDAEKAKKDRSLPPDPAYKNHLY